MKTMIAFCGLAGSGKDTACDHLVKHHGFKKTSFAAPLKQMVKIAFGFTDEQLYGPSPKREEQDKCYPFSGVCVACGGNCRLVTGDVYVGDHYSCTLCFRGYPKYINARIALQTLGTEWGRRLNEDVWARAGVNHMLNNEGDRWCLSDLRFANELKAVKEAGGVVVRLTRGEVQHSHPSEIELTHIPLSHFDHVITNNNSELEQLFADLDKVVQKFSLPSGSTT